MYVLPWLIYYFTHTRVILWVTCNEYKQYNVIILIWYRDAVKGIQIIVNGVYSIDSTSPGQNAQVPIIKRRKVIILIVLVIPLREDITRRAWQVPQNVF